MGSARRSVPGLLVALLLAGLVIACSARDPGPAGGPASPVAVQVVAHQDDDLLFMNPDVRDEVRSGRPTVTVFLTSGEAGVADGSRYAADRQAGTRAGYARMAGVPDDWTGEALSIDRDHQVELYALRARPQVRVVFVDLPEDSDGHADGGRHALTRLWQDRTESVRVRTVVPTGAQVHRAFGYTRRDVLETLLALFTRYRPTVVRTQDTTPDPAYPQWLPWHDHPDHVVAARFTEEAAADYRASAGQPRFALVNYRDYNTERAPANLGPDQQRLKVEDFAAYLKHDRLASNRGSYDRWPRRRYYRWPRGTTWATVDRAGGVHAFAVLAGRLTGWSRRADGTWSGPDDLGDPGGDLAPAVTAAQTATGPVVCARRLDDDTVACRDGARWTGLGSPNDQANQGSRSDLGLPVLAARADGRLVLVVRRGGGGISRRDQVRPGEWGSGWTSLPGPDPRDGLATAPGADGDVDVLASTGTEVVRVPARDGVQRLDGQRPAGPPVAVCPAGGDRRVTVLYPVADTGELASTPRTGDGPWSKPAVFPGPGEPGGPAAVDLAGRVAVVGRGVGGRVAFTEQTTPGGAFPGWSDLGGATVDYPTAVVDRSGALVVLAVGPDGRLQVDERHPGAPFTGWRAVG